MSVQGFNGQNERDPSTITFHPQSTDEYNIPFNYGPQFPTHLGVRPKYQNYACGACEKHTTGRVLCDAVRPCDGATMLWCICACDKREPTTIVISRDRQEMIQLPQAKRFHAGQEWPTELANLYEEASKAFSAGAFTSSSLVCRKILMSCVCHEQAKNGKPKEGESFTYYVNFLVDNILTLPSAREAIIAIKDIGNDATHHVDMVNPKDAERSMRIVQYMLNAIYSLPLA